MNQWVVLTPVPEENPGGESYVVNRDHVSMITGDLVQSKILLLGGKLIELHTMPIKDTLELFGLIQADER